MDTKLLNVISMLMMSFKRIQLVACMTENGFKKITNEDNPIRCIKHNKTQQADTDEKKEK